MSVLVIGVPRLWQWRIHHQMPLDRRLLWRIAPVLLVGWARRRFGVARLHELDRERIPELWHTRGHGQVPVG